MGFVPRFRGQSSVPLPIATSLLSISGQETEAHIRSKFNREGRLAAILARISQCAFDPGTPRTDRSGGQRRCAGTSNSV